MDPEEARQRSAVVAEARSWIGTPYHHQADIKGVGVDCGMIIARVFADTGVIEPYDPRPYSDTWMVHQNEERYLNTVRLFTKREFDPRETPPQPGDIVIWKWGRTFSHGAIVTGWPNVVHAYADARLVEEISTVGCPLMMLGRGPRPLIALSPWT